MTDDLTALRAQIDQIDHQLIDRLAERMATSRQIASLKSRRGQAVRDPERERVLLAERAASGQVRELNTAFVIDLFELILSESRRVQTEYTKE